MARKISPITWWGVRAVPALHAFDRAGEEVCAGEDVGVFREEAEDEPSHEVVHMVPAVDGAPVGVLLQQFDVEPVQASGRLDVEGAFADLFDGRDAGERQEEAEMLGKSG